jgi:transcriptional regulator with GAF, ATPase, and Fis domain
MHPGVQTSNSRLGESGLKELDLLCSISEIVHSVDTSRERFLEIMKLLDETFGKRYGTLTLLSPCRSKVLLEVVFGDPSEERACVQGLNLTIIKEILECAQPMAFSRITQKPLPIPSGSHREKDVSLLCIPIMNNTRAVGVMGTTPIYRDTASFEQDIRLLRVIACMAFRDTPLPGDDQSRSRESTGDHPLDRILEEKLRQMVEKVDPRTESRCALLPDIVNLVEKIVIKWALRRHHNIQTATAHFLGINRNTLRKKAKDLNIHFQKP